MSREDNDNIVPRTDSYYLDKLPPGVLTIVSNYIDSFPSASLEEALKNHRFWEIAFLRDFPIEHECLQRQKIDFSTLTQTDYNETFEKYYGRLEENTQNLFLWISQNNLEGIRSLPFNKEWLYNTYDHNGYDPIRWTSYRKRETILTYFYEQACTLLFSEEDPFDERGNSKLGWAARCGQLEEVKKELLARSKDGIINQVNLNYDTPLLLASANGHHEVVEYLLEREAPVDFSNVNNLNTPLLLASENGHLAVVECLILNGANANLARKDGTTPFIMAILQGRLVVVEYFLENVAEVNQTKYKDLTPLAIAKRKNHQEIVALLNLYDMSRSLEERVCEYLKINKDFFAGVRKNIYPLFSLSLSPEEMLSKSLESDYSKQAVEAALKTYQKKCPAVLTEQKYEKILSVLFSNIESAELACANKKCI